MVSTYSYGRTGGYKMFRQFGNASKFRSFYRSAYNRKTWDNSKDDKFCIVTSPSPLDPVIGLTVPEFLWSNLHKWENAIAFECGVSGRKYTHGEIYKNSRNFAVALKQNGLKPNDVVALILPNVPEFPTAILGVWEAGMVASTFNPSYTSDEIGRQIIDCEAKTIVTLPQLVPVVKEALKQCPQQVKSIITIGEPPEGCHSFFEMTKVSSQGAEFSKGSKLNTLEDTAILPYSSGTTGPPKGVMLTHTNICTNLLQITYPGFIASDSFENGNPQERFIGILPFFHIYGFQVVMLNSILIGAYTNTLPKFNPPNFINAMRGHKPSVCHLVPPLMAFLGNSPDVKSEDFASLKAIMGGAAPIGPTLVNKLLDKAGKYFLFQEGYGMTELSPVSHMVQRWTKNTKIGSCGSIMAGSMCKVVDEETGAAVGPNKRGEICVKGPHVMKGYFKNEKATKETIDSDGWLHTGDIGMYDEDHMFWIVDRLKELIKVRGFQVAPSELEDILRKHPDVADVAVIGVPDERAGELPRAYIVLKSENVSEDRIHEYLHDKISTHKKLKGGVEFVKAIPKAASGKILRRELKKDYLSKHQ